MEEEGLLILKRRDISVKLNSGPEVVVSLDPGRLHACTNVIRSDNGVPYRKDLKLLVGFFDCPWTGHGHSKSVFVEIWPADIYANRDLLGGRILQDLGPGFDIGSWDEIELEIPMPAYPRLSIEPELVRSPVRALIKPAGELTIERYRVGRRRRGHRDYVLVP